MNLNRSKFSNLWPLCAVLIFLLAANFSRFISSDSLTSSPSPLHPAGEIGTLLTFGLDQVIWLQTLLFNNPLWAYLAGIIYVVLAFYLAEFLDHFIQVQLSRLFSTTETQLKNIILELARGPVKVMAFMILVRIGLKAFTWPAWVDHSISTSLTVVIAAILTYLLMKGVDIAIGLWQIHVAKTDQTLLDTHLFGIVQKTAKVFIVIIAMLVTLQNIGMNVTGLLASLSIGGLAVSLAAQDTLSNLFGAVALFSDKPFRIGDRIQVDQVDGIVEEIGIRSTRVRSLDGYLVTIPNRTMANGVLINISKRPTIKTTMNIGLTYDTPTEKIERAIKIIEETYRSHPKTGDLIVSFNKFGDSALNILVVHWWSATDYKEYLAGMQQMNLKLKKQFDDEAISFAFPSQTIYLRQDSDWKVASGTVKLG